MSWAVITHVEIALIPVCCASLGMLVSWLVTVTMRAWIEEPEHAMD